MLPAGEGKERYLYVQSCGMEKTCGHGWRFGICTQYIDAVKSDASKDCCLIYFLSCAKPTISRGFSSPTRTRRKSLKESGLLCLDCSQRWTKQRVHRFQYGLNCRTSTLLDHGKAEMSLLASVSDYYATPLIQARPYTFSNGHTCAFLEMRAKQARILPSILKLSTAALRTKLFSTLDWISNVFLRVMELLDGAIHSLHSSLAR